MANILPPAGLVFSPPPPLWKLLPPPPPPPRSPSFIDNSSNSGKGAFTATVGIYVAGVVLVLLVCICGGIASEPPATPAPEPREDNDNDECRPRRAGATTAAGLPSFTYTKSLKHNVTGSDEAATCSVCLGALEVGETVRLLPVCLHLYHAECIDPWLFAHSTCPICRSSTRDEGPLPPV